MEVNLISYTHLPDELCGSAAAFCQTNKNYSEISVAEATRSLKTAIKEGHESVLEHAVFTFEIMSVSRVLTHQLIRHRIASYSQKSGRHLQLKELILPDTLSTEEKGYMRGIIANNVQGYNILVGNGTALEDARYILPQGTSTSIIVTMNGRELRQFFLLRMDVHAQQEIRVLAYEMYSLVKEAAPIMFSGIKKQINKKLKEEKNESK